VGTDEVARIGGKAASLVWLRDCGFEPPPFDVLGTERWNTPAFASLERDIAALDLSTDPLARSTLAASLRARIEQLALPDEVVQRVTADFNAGRYGRSVAVRSSAATEDSATASSAGQYESVLGVRSAESIIHAIRRVLASYFGDRAVAYRRNRGIHDRALPMAVIVQELVHAKVSGIAFSDDPLGVHPGCCVIESSWGLGEAIVGGRVQPDHFVISRSGDLVKRKLGSKKIRLVENPGDENTVEEQVTGDRRWSITDDEARLVSQLVARAAAAAGKVVDVEWAIPEGEDSKVSFLQIRPVTVMRQSRDQEHT
jgi:pyruvate,water dikinase